MPVPGTMEPRVPRAALPRVLVLLATASSLLLLGLVLRAAWPNGRSFLDWARAAVAYPFELDYGEGPILSQTTRLMHGLSIYRPTSEPPFNIGNYPPVYHLVVSLVARFHSPLLSAGRLVTASSTLLTAGLIGTAVAVAAARPLEASAMWAPAGMVVRVGAGAVGGMLFLATKPVYFWGAFMRVDMLAVLLSVAGVLTYLVWQGKGWSAYVTVGLFLLAAYTKQSTVAGALAGLLTAGLLQPRRALFMGFVGLIGGATVFAVVDVLTGGQFFFHLITANNNAFRWETVRWFFTDVFGLHYPLLCLAALGALVSLAMLGRAPRGLKPSSRLLLPIYLVSASVVSLTVGKVGSSFNYLVELMAAMSICTGVLLADALVALPRAASRAVSVRPSFRLMGASLLSLVAAGAIAYAILGYSQQLEPSARGWVPMPSEGMRANSEQALGHIMRTGGPVLSEVMTFMTLADMDVEFQPFELTQLSYQGIWNQEPLLRAIAARKYRLVVLTFDIMDDPGWHSDRFTPEMLAAIRENYVQVADYGGLRFYEPSW